MSRGLHKDVGIVLVEAAHAKKSAERSRGFMAMHMAKFSDAQRQFAIAVSMGFVKRACSPGSSSA